MFPKAAVFLCGIWFDNKHFFSFYSTHLTRIYTAVIDLNPRCASASTSKTNDCSWQEKPLAKITTAIHHSEPLIDVPLTTNLYCLASENPIHLHPFFLYPICWSIGKSVILWEVQDVPWTYKRWVLPMHHCRWSWIKCMARVLPHLQNAEIPETLPCTSHRGKFAWIKLIERSHCLPLELGQGLDQYVNAHFYLLF